MPFIRVRTDHLFKRKTKQTEIPWENELRFILQRNTSGNEKCSFLLV